MSLTIDQQFMHRVDASMTKMLCFALQKMPMKRLSTVTCIAKNSTEVWQIGENTSCFMKMQGISKKENGVNLGVQLIDMQRMKPFLSGLINFRRENMFLVYA